MTYIVTITSQGQVSIPAKIRRNLGLNKSKKAVVRQEGKSIILEPVKDLLELEGVFKHKAIKNKSIGQVMKMEEKAWEEAAVERYLKSSKK